jgi:hypothetical protein
MNESTLLYQVIELTDTELKEQLMKLEKEELSDMVINANKMIKLFNPQVYDLEDNVEREFMNKPKDEK